MWTSYLFLAIAALLPVVATVGFHFLNKYTKFNNLNFWAKQIIYGVVFGGLAIVGTHWSIKFNGFAANARDAAVLIGGLIFGGPAGIIAGTIGGLERMIVGLIPSFGMGFTVIACSISTFLAGVASAIIRALAFEKKRPGIFSGLFTGLVIEVFHLFMVFVTNANEYQKAYDCILACTPPMLIANSLAVFIGLIVINFLEGQNPFKKPDTNSLTSRFTYTLSTLTFVAFILSSTFVFFFNDTMAQKTTNNNLSYAINETASEISYKTVEKAEFVRTVIYNNPELDAYPGDMSDRLNAFATSQDISEINLVKIDGFIEYSSVREYADGNFNMNIQGKGHEQSYEFYKRITDPNGPGYFVQEFRLPDSLLTEERKYAGVLFEYDFDKDGTKEPGFIQVGYNKDQVDGLTKSIAKFKNVGNTGALIILSKEFSILSKGNEVVLPNDLTPLTSAIQANKQGETFRFVVDGVEYYAQFKFEDTHYIVSLLPANEALLSRNISIFVNTFLEVIVFGLFFVTIFVLVKKLVIDRIALTNKALNRIAGGNLYVAVKGEGITEFQELANDINHTVSVLKGYTDAANKRIDEELAMAKAIQTAVLPSTFPAFPDRKEFDIFASMHPAKEVGGDFYDFYFSNQDHFHFTIADVSGKGIPAALFMMRAKSVLKSLTQTNIPINEAFAKANDSLCDGNEAGMFVTAWSASVDLTNGQLTFANGGHNPPLIKHKNGKFEYLRAPVNLVLAAMDGMPYGINKLQLEVGDIVYLYTDGVTEGVNTKGEQLGEQRLLDILNAKEFSSCEELCEYVYKECATFAAGAAQFDDITMVAFRFDGFKK